MPSSPHHQARWQSPTPSRKRKPPRAVEQARRRQSPPPGSTWALLPLRVFLGVTFCFAGLQKLANPAFFDPASPISIQSQLAAASRRSPVHALLGPLGHLATPIGVVIALSELAVGTGTLLGFRVRLAAVGGMVLSFMLFLTVSFHAIPYYTGADIVFFFAWIPFVIGGGGDLLSLDSALFRAQRPRPGVAGQRTVTTTNFDRRAFLRRTGATAAVATLGVLSASLAAAAGRLAGRSRTTPDAPSLGQLPTTVPTSTPSPSSTSAVQQPPSPGRPAGTAIGRAADVPVGGSASFQDPATGDPSLVIQPTAGDFLAFDAVCPHAGCVVQYFPPQGIFVCPCHGSQFNSRSGAVEQGPAARGLTPIAVTDAGGELYVT